MCPLAQFHCKRHKKTKELMTVSATPPNSGGNGSGHGACQGKTGTRLRWEGFAARLILERSRVCKL